MPALRPKEWMYSVREYMSGKNLLHRMLPFSSLNGPLRVSRQCESSAIIQQSSMFTY